MDFVPPGMKKKIYFVANLNDVMARYQGKSINCFLYSFVKRNNALNPGPFSWACTSS
jgi:hypothetical protein